MRIQIKVRNLIVMDMPDWALIDALGWGSGMFLSQEAKKHVTIEAKTEDHRITDSVVWPENNDD